MGTVAPSITLTATTESCAFLLGAVSQMPAVRAFSLYAGCAVLFNFLLQVGCHGNSICLCSLYLSLLFPFQFQITVFISILKVDMTLLKVRAALCNKDELHPINLFLSLHPKCCLGCFERQFYRLGRINGISLLQKIVREYSKVILHWSVRPIVVSLHHTLVHKCVTAPHTGTQVCHCTAHRYTSVSLHRTSVHKCVTAPHTGTQVCHCTTHWYTSVSLWHIFR